MAKFNNWNVNCRLFAQSFLSSRTCLSIISLNMIYLFIEFLVDFEMKAQLNDEREVLLADGGGDG